jgi:hypothetical protein
VEVVEKTQKIYHKTICSFKGTEISLYQGISLFLCNRHWFNKAPGPDPRGTELGVTYLPSTINSDAGYADLPLPLLGAPVSIGTLVKATWVTVSYEARPRLVKTPSQDRTTCTLSASSG